MEQCERCNARWMYPIQNDWIEDEKADNKDGKIKMWCLLETF
jgi:hypothetical protein